MRVHRSAYRHGVTDPDIRHAVANALAEIELDDSRLLVLGPNRAANLLEIVLVDDTPEPIAIHAMRMRPQFARWLPPTPVEPEE